MAMTRERLFKAATEAEDAVRLVRRDLGLKRYDAADRKLKALEDLLEKLRRLLKQQARIGETEPEVMLEPTED
jgi:vacuolar-type H+-ATPase subunit I/STV1